jgi:Type I phosphodiesterase / nucleotide pyrophosphatase
VAARLVLLVLDGFSPRHLTPTIAPNLVRAGEDGARPAGGGRAVLTAATYPNHASLVTGAEPAVHGIFANDTFTAAGIRPAQEVGAGPTLLDAAGALGLFTAVVVGDPKILGVVGAARCQAHWPPGGVLPPGTPLVRGYAANSVTFAALLDVLDREADVVVCQLDNTDGVSHMFGPDSPEAVAMHAEADALVGKLVATLRAGRRWPETILAVVSDHSQLATDPDRPPVDVPRALNEAGIEAEVIEEGSAGLVRARDLEAARRVVAALDGVASVRELVPGVLGAYARPGRGFNTRKPIPRGIHGCPDTMATLCVVTGGHPAVAGLRETFATATPTNATLGRLLAASAGLPSPGSR